jgi:hypothetical protein
MLRGSRPGERRGGRKLDTPNRRTILTESILAIGADHPTASWKSFLQELLRDSMLPADIRMAVAQKCFPAKRRPRGRPRRAEVFQDRHTEGAGPAGQDWNPEALEALLGIVQDAAAEPKARRQAALKVAQLLLPKSPKKAKILPDEYGFRVSPKLAAAYRDIQLELRSLKNSPSHKIPAIAQRIQKLETRSAAILRRLECPCTSTYHAEKHVAEDLLSLGEFTRRRDAKIALTEAEDAEEAHIKVRFDVFAAGPEQTARRRRAELQQAARLFRNRVPGARPLSRQERSTLKLLRWLYPVPHTPLYSDEFAMNLDFHPFRVKSPAWDGCFYPPDSKLRPAAASAADDRLLDAVDGPPTAPLGADTDSLPGPADFCAFCFNRIGPTYLRESPTGFFYCSRWCNENYANIRR